MAQRRGPVRGTETFLVKEIRAAHVAHFKKWPRRPLNRFKTWLTTIPEIESQNHIAWLKGYLQAMKDGRPPCTSAKNAASSKAKPKKTKKAR